MKLVDACPCYFFEFLKSHILNNGKGNKKISRIDSEKVSRLLKC